MAKGVFLDNCEAQRSFQYILRNCLPDFISWEAIVHPRLFTRVRPVGKGSGEAKLIVDPKAPVIDCRVVDYSPGGACLETAEQIKLPARFELLFGGTRKRCRVVWSAGRRVGVAF